MTATLLLSTNGDFDLTYRVQDQKASRRLVGSWGLQDDPLAPLVLVPFVTPIGNDVSKLETQVKACGARGWCIPFDSGGGGFVREP